MTTKKVCAFALECFNHPDSEVRNIGKNIAVYVYERGNRDAIRKTLEHNLEDFHSHALARSLFAELSQIDQNRCNLF
uniref:Uncharacterized protein n=1 Tax=Ditylenchus dipsaci TaxID=166011 RepID=A0A915DLW6_9BILA